MLDFASALYLGLRHSSRKLRPWQDFTMGQPAALGQPAIAGKVERELAALQGTEQAMLVPSTLHLFWDWFGYVARQRPVIALDEGTYPIARWGAERAFTRGAALATFRHHDPHALEELLSRCKNALGRCLIVTDGFCPSCGQAAPLAEYHQLARAIGGLQVVDDTQALGIFGESLGRHAPYGNGGGGMLRHANIEGPEVVVGSSLAKAFGVPLAVLSGPSFMIERFKQASETRVHCSPPSLPALHAGEHALRINREFGDHIRMRLARLIRHFRARMRSNGLGVGGGLFPVQTLSFPPEAQVKQIHADLLRREVRAVLHRSRDNGRPLLSFLITARHTFSQLDFLAGSLLEITQSLFPSSFTR